MIKTIAARLPVDAVSDAEKSYGKTTTRLQVATAVWSLWERLRKEHGLDQQWLADRMGKDKSRASRLLNAPGNWTLDTVGEILEAMGGRITLVEAHTYEEIAQGKLSRISRPAAARMVVKIEAEIVIDEIDRIEFNDAGWIPSVSIGRLHPLAKPIDEQVETI
jgi:hypothetical protein